MKDRLPSTVGLLDSFHAHPFPATLLLITTLTACTVLPSNSDAASIIDREGAQLDLGGDIKGRFVAMQPYEHLLMPDDPIGQGLLMARARLELSLADFLYVSAHHQLAGELSSGSSGLSGSMLGDPSGQGTPEAIPLSWRAGEADSQVQLRGRMDRLSLRLRSSHATLTIGRQPITFGSTWFFTPLDRVAPFAATVIDREYKPGVDAIRGDFFFGTANQITTVAAYAGGWQLEGLVLAASGRFNVGLWDITALLAAAHGDFIAGLDASGSIGDIGLRGAIAYTVPPEESQEDAFLQVVFGGDYRSPSGLHFMAELYYQDIGAASTSGYLPLSQSPRFQRGELWAMGRLYAAFSLNYELSPVLSTTTALTMNLLDGSALFSPGLSWSIAGNADLVVGAMFALGKRPRELDLTQLIGSDGRPIAGDQFVEVLQPRSEFGLVPHTGYLQINSYF